MRISKTPLQRIVAFGFDPVFDGQEEQQDFSVAAAIRVGAYWLLRPPHLREPRPPVTPHEMIDEAEDTIDLWHDDGPPASIVYEMDHLGLPGSPFDGVSTRDHFSPSANHIYASRLGMENCILNVR